MSFAAIGFLAALVAAAGPTVIHLLNRRRFRTVEWGAMRFLRQAVNRHRRMLEFRDLLLLALRTLALVLIVLAMARPYWVRTSQAGEGAGDQPIHAVIAVDNSLSMGYTQLDKSLLDAARDKARRYIRDLPRGSVVSLLPMCQDDEQWQTGQAYARPQEALEALDRLSVVDLPADAARTAERARAACQAVPDVPTKRVVFLSDLQGLTWQPQGLRQYLADLPDVQIARVGGEGGADVAPRPNTWVESFSVRDGVADAESPAVFLATIRHEGTQPRSRLRAVLKIDDVEEDQRDLDLVPGQSLKVEFRHQFRAAGTSRQPLLARAALEIHPPGRDDPDHLTADNVRYAVVPVVAELPVLFIDSLGAAGEKPQLNRYGETYHLRRLLAPRTRGTEEARHLVRIRHLTPEQVTREDLREARLVVMAGVRSPQATLVDELRQYVEQGGPLFLAAGGAFDPAAWTGAAWRQGAGILPLPLKPQPVGQVPLPGDRDPEWFRLATGTLTDEVFQLPQNDPQRLKELFAAPFFFRIVEVDAGPDADAALREHAREVRRRYEWRLAHEADEVRWHQEEARGQLSAEERRRRDADRLRRRESFPAWLAWEPPPGPDLASMSAEALAQHGAPMILGRFENGHAVAVRRRLGAGQVLFFSSGVLPEWNTLAREYAVILLDQAMRDLLGDTFPVTNLAGARRLVVPVDPQRQKDAFTVLAPGEREPAPLPVEALGAQAVGLRVPCNGQRGIYIIEGRPAAVEGAASGPPTSRFLLAVNGVPGESDLRPAPLEELKAELSLPQVRFLDPDQPLSLEGPTIIGHRFWKTLIVLAGLCLLGEMAFLTFPAMRQWWTVRRARQAHIPTHNLDHSGRAA